MISVLHSKDQHPYLGSLLCGNLRERAAVEYSPRVRVAWHKFHSRGRRAAYPELSGGPQQLVVLGSDVGGRWNAAVQQLLRDFRVSAQRARTAVRSTASTALAKALVGHAGNVGAQGSGQLGRHSRPQSWSACSALLTPLG